MPGYPQDLLSNRSVVKHDFAIITPQGRVINTIPGIVDTKMTILCSPKIGAGASCSSSARSARMRTRNTRMQRPLTKSPSSTCSTALLSSK